MTQATEIESFLAGFDTHFTHPLYLSDAGCTPRGTAMAKARALAARLQASGREGDRVLILCDRPEAAVSGFFACIMAGLCAVPLHPATPDAGMAHIRADSGAALLISDRASDVLPQPLVDLPLIAPTDTETGAPLVQATPDPARMVALLYTSGTTGAPRSVMVTLGNLACAADRLKNDFFRLDARDVILMAAPLSNIYGVCMASVALVTGAGLSFAAALRPDALIAALVRDKVTFMTGVPLLGQLVLGGARQAGTDLPDLRRVLPAGTKLDPALADAMAGTFGCEVMTGYAMTEAVPIAIALDHRETPPGLVGQIAPGLDLQIVNEDMAPAPQGEAGEILIRGDMVTPGYWQNESANSAAFHEGWFRTGDVGRLDAEGRLFLVDRIKELIKTAGNTVFPSEVETVLRAHPALRDVAVVGAPNNKLGEVVAAHVIAADPANVPDAATLRARCAERLIAFKLPRRFVFHDSFPMTASGKVAKHQLATQAKADV